MAYLAVDKRWTRALRITVSRAIACAGWVQRALASVREHLTEVKSTIGTAWELAHIHVEGELLIQQREHVVSCLIGEQVDSRGDKTGGPIGPVDKEVEGQLAAVGVNPGSSVVDALEITVGSACFCIGAYNWVETVGFAVGVVVCVNPSVVGIQDQGGVLLNTATSEGTLPCWKLGMDFGGQFSCLLGCNGGGQQGRQESPWRHGFQA